MLSPPPLFLSFSWFHETICCIWVDGDRHNIIKDFLFQQLTVNYLLIKFQTLILFVACSDGTYGYQCLYDCACNRTNSIDCDDVTGKCECKDNWNGTTCSIHVNDCLNGSAVCDSKTQQCAKKDGTESYFCVCLYGKNNTDNGTCLCKYTIKLFILPNLFLIKLCTYIIYFTFCLKWKYDNFFFSPNTTAQYK